jgi:hypothetical protein
VTTCTEQQTQLSEEILARISSDLSMITDREFKIEEMNCELTDQRAVGKDKIHISFKLGFQSEDGDVQHGCIIMPLADAISLACFLMMVPDDGVKTKRAVTDLDESLKDALIEVSNFIGGAADAALREAIDLGTKVRSEGCQGVRPDVRPAFVYEDGQPLIVTTAKAQVHEFEEFEMVAMLPPIGDPQ